MKDFSPTAAIWAGSAFVRNLIAAGLQRPTASDNGGVSRKIRITSGATTTANGSGAGGMPIPITAAASGPRQARQARPKDRPKARLKVLPKVCYKIPSVRYKIPPRRCKTPVFNNPR